MRRVVLMLWVWSCLLGMLITAQEGVLPACSQRPTQVLLPRARIGFCLEKLYQEQNFGELAFTALAFSADNTLYATRPLYGQLLVIEDSNQDNLPDTPRVIAENLDLPNALTWHADALYITGGRNIYRWQNNQLSTLVDDLPSGTGFWNGGIVVHDERLIVGIGADCALCTPTENTRGILVSYDLNGADRQVIARGLHQPTALAIWQDTLWVSDTHTNSSDELNLWTANADFSTQDPIYRFAPNTFPSALLAYHGTAFPELNNHALLLLSGQANNPFPEGYQLIAIERTPDTNTFKHLIPHDTSITASQDVLYQTQYVSADMQVLTARGAGFFPHHPIGLAIDTHGWIFISTTGGYLYLLRPV
jgi:glucose/arabinose dehydrogenase